MTVASGSTRSSALPRSTIPLPISHVLRAARDPGEAGAAVRVAHGEECLLEAHARAEQLAGPEPVAGPERVAPADLPPVDADPLGEPVEEPVEGEGHLGDAEAAEGAGRRVVRVGRARLHVHVGDSIGAAGVARGPLEDLRSDAGIGARVADDPRPHGDEAAFGIAAHLVVHGQGVALRVEPEALAAREGEEDRLSGHLRQQRGLALDGEVLLAPEGAAGRRPG